MIRLVYLLRRVPAMTLEDFHHHLRGVRGPLVARHSTSLRIRRCVHSFHIDEPRYEEGRKSRGMVDPYDAVEELWFNSLEEATASFRSADGKLAATELVEDERRFVDFARSSLWFAIELPQINPCPENILAQEHSRIVKLFYPLRHISGLTLEAAQLHWRMNHGPLVRSVAPALGVKRYIQVHRLPAPLAVELRALRGSMEEPYTGHAESWSDRLEQARSRELPEAVRAFSLAVQDEGKFIDPTRSTIFLTKERIVTEL